MPLLAGHMTKLEAVNDMLASIGERAVSSLASGHPDAASAEAVLDRVSREIQTQGWYHNTLFDYVITRNNDSQFALPDNTLKVDTVNPQGFRKTTTPPFSDHINVAMRRSADDTRWILWDVDNNSETWPNDTEVTVELVQNFQFANLSPALQFYVWTKAAHRWQKGLMGSQVLFEFTREDVIEAKAMAEQEDLEASDANVIHDNLTSRYIVQRHNRAFRRQS